MPRKILIVLHGSIGDVTRALPLASLVRRGFPQARVVWSIEPACLPLVQGYPGIDGVIVFERQRGWKEFLRFEPLDEWAAYARSCLQVGG